MDTRLRVRVRSGLCRLLGFRLGSSSRVVVRVRVRKMLLIGQDKAARSAGEGDERNRERAREAVHPRREKSWAPAEGKQRVLEGLCRGNSRYWRAAEDAETGVHWCVQCAQ